MKSKTIKVALAFAVVLAVGMAQDPPKPAAAAAPKKVAKDQAEADLINTIMKEQNAATRLTELEKWQKDYPDSQFAQERDNAMLTAYQQTQKYRETFNKALEILGKRPNDFTAMYMVIADLPLLNNANPAPADLDNAEKVVNHVLNDGDTVFAPANKPETMTDAQWSPMKASVQPLAQKTLGYIYLQRKDNARAETELTKALKMDPTQGSSSYMLSQALMAQREKDLTKQAPSIFELARAAEYDGPNSLPAAMRKTLETTVKKYYAQYHGSDDGVDKLLAVAKTNALPPADFTIKSTADIAKDKIEADEKARAAAGPMLTFWRDLKTNLTGADGDNYFNNTVKDTALPPGGATGVTKFKGKLISTSTPRNPKEITIAIDSPTVADCTLKLDEGYFPGTMEPGGDIEFDGTAKAFTKDPFMLTFEVTKEQVAGWTGKGAPAAKKGPTTKKKAQ